MIETIESFVQIGSKLRAAGKKIVLATGFFDLLHTEHVKFLQKAAAVGDVLVIAIESDLRARQLKGEGRPIQPQRVRCQQVEKYGDYVIALADNFNNPAAYESLIASVHPDIYAVSSHTGYLESKQRIVEKYGGKLVIVHEWNPATSTTQIINIRRPAAAGLEVSTSKILSSRRKQL